MKRIIALILAVVLMSCFTAYAGAAENDESPVGGSGEWIASDASNLLGDVDGNKEVNIADALYLQYYLSKMRTLSAKGVNRADVDMNNAAESTDVTYIQRFLVGFDTVDYIGCDVDKVKAEIEQRRRDQQILSAINNFKRAKGVDISEHNGSVDMKKLRAAGYSFVIIRLGYGSNYTDQDDVRFEENVRNAEAAGLNWGAYLYSYALSVNDAKSEVNHTLRLLKGKHPTMPIAFDWEEDSYKERMGMPSNANVLKIANTYMDGIRAAGYYPIIYTGYNWLKGAFNNKAFLDKNDLWLAQWSSTYDYHDRPLGMWQYGGSVNFIESPYISGLSGEFDKNYCYKNYPWIIKGYGYNNFTAQLSSQAMTGDAYDAYDEEEIGSESEPLPPECDGVMGDSLRAKSADPQTTE